MYIGTRLNELEAEKEELQLFQEADKNRRSIEYTIYLREQAGAIDALELLDDQRQTEVQDAQETIKNGMDQEKIINELQLDIRSLKDSIQSHEFERGQINGDQKDALTARAKLQLSLKDQQELLGAAGADRDDIKLKLTTIEDSMKIKQSELNRLLPRFDASSREEVETKERFYKV